MPRVKGRKQRIKLRSIYKRCPKGYTGIIRKQYRRRKIHRVKICVKK